MFGVANEDMAQKDASVTAMTLIAITTPMMSNVMWATNVGVNVLSDMSDNPVAFANLLFYMGRCVQ